MPFFKFMRTFLKWPSKKRTVAGLSALFFLFLVFQIPSLARSRIENILHDAGFTDVTINRISVSPVGVKAEDIKLDADGMDEIKSIEAILNWITFLPGGDVSELRVKGVRLNRESESLSSSARQLIQNLLHLPAYRIHISDVTLDMSTFFGDIRVNLEATVNDLAAKDQSRNIKARITANQYQLGFDSTWQGVLDKAGNLDVAGTVPEGRMNIGPLRISRFNGWIDFKTDKKDFSLQSQMEAGSAEFMDVPLQNILVVNDLDASHHTAMIRSGISGMPDVLFAADMIRSEKSASFTSILKGKNLARLMKHVNETTKSSNPIRETLIDFDDFQFICDFEPEKRFVGGPMPFSLRLLTGENNVVNGNVLFYPDTFDVRGSLETDIDTASALQDYFKIPSKNMKQNFIRLDGNAKGLLRLRGNEKSKAPTS